MEQLIVEIFKYFTTSLTPVELIVAIAIIVPLMGFIVNFVVKRRKAIKSFFGKGEDEDLKAINKQLEVVATHDDLGKLETSLRNEIASQRFTIEAFKSQFIEVSAIRQEMINKGFDGVIQELQENRDFIVMKHERTAEQQALILTSTARALDEHQKLVHRIERIDEFLRTVAPEFRTYHRDIDNELNMLSRDLAVIERSLQLSLNSNSGVKLR